MLYTAVRSLQGGPLVLASGGERQRQRAVCAWQRPTEIRSRRRLAASTERGEDNTATPDRTTAADPQCYGTGMEVECTVPEYAERPDASQDPSNSSTSSSTSSTSSSSSTMLSQLVDTALLISPFFFWGTSMVAMKTLDMPPMFMAAWRCLPAGAVLLVWAKLKGEKGPSSAVGWLAVSLFGLVDGACFQGFLAEGLQRTSAGLGSVIIDSQPLSVALLSSLLFGETLGVGGIVGLVLGVSGLLLLEGQSGLSGLSGLSGATLAESSSGGFGLSGEAFMFLAAQSMATGTLMVRWVSKYCDPVTATGLHLLIGGLPLAALTLADGGAAATTDMLAHASTNDALLLLYVSLFGSAASYGVFFYLATVKGSLTRLSSLTFLTPMFAAAGGYLLLGETLTPIQLVGAFVTLVGVTALNVSDDEEETKKRE